MSQQKSSNQEDLLAKTEKNRKQTNESIKKLPPDNIIRKTACYDKTKDILALQQFIGAMDEKIKGSKNPSQRDITERAQAQEYLGQILEDYNEINCNETKLTDIHLYEKVKSQSEGIRAVKIICLFFLGLLLFCMVILHFGYESVISMHFGVSFYTFISMVLLLLFLLFMGWLVIGRVDRSSED